MSLEKILQRANIRPDIPLLPSPSYRWTDRKRPLQEYTKRFLKNLRRPIKPGLIEFVSVVLIGTMGYGKTKVAEWITEMVIQHYGTEAVNSIANRHADLETLMGGMNAQPVQILFLDDSFGKMDKEIAKEFTQIRHRFRGIREEAGEANSGVIIAIFAIQEIFSLDKLARRVATSIIAKSSSSDRFYRQELSSVLGKKGLEELDCIIKKVLCNYD